MTRILLASLLTLSLCPPLADAQTREAEPGFTLSSLANFTPAKEWLKRDYGFGFWRLALLSKDYELGPGDEIQVQIYGVTELSSLLQTAALSNSGEIHVPLVGPMRVAGLTAEAVEEQVGQALVDRGLVQEPEVIVTVTEYAAKPVYIIGEVDNPGEYVMRQSWTLTEAVLIAGGVDLGAARYGYLHRRSAAGAPMTPPERLDQPDVPLPGREVITVDLQPLKTGKVLDPDPLLQAGDLFVIPTSVEKMAYVLGAVLEPGGISLRPDERLPLSLALAAAGGPSRTASSRGLIVRTTPEGSRSVTFDFRAILAGKERDQLLRPDDIVFIPGSGVKTLGAAVAQMVPALARTAATIAMIP